MSNLVTDTPRSLDEHAFRALAAGRLRPTPASEVFSARTGGVVGPSDFELDPELLADLPDPAFVRHAAVLVPVIARARLTVLLTQRTDHLASHAGQISFPGGKVEAGDQDAAATALREAWEEIGLDRALVEPLGFLDSYRTRTGFHIVPLVALVRPDFELRLDASEVADAFEVPLEFLMDPANHSRHSREVDGRRRYYYAMPFGQRYIWGATAGMIKNMHDRLLA